MLNSAQLLIHVTRRGPVQSECSIWNHGCRQTHLDAAALNPSQRRLCYWCVHSQAFGSSTQKQAAALANQAGSYARCMVQLYQQLQAAFGSSYGSSSSSKVHCSFNPRHLTSWVQGLQR
jgi:hypothetical protein